MNYQQAREILPQLHLVSDDDLSQLLSIELPGNQMFSKVAEFNVVIVDAQNNITAVQHNDETVQLAEAVGTRGRPVLEWLKALLAQVPATLRQRFQEAWATDLPLAALAARFPQCTVV